MASFLIRKHSAALIISVSRTRWRMMVSTALYLKSVSETNPIPNHSIVVYETTRCSYKGSCILGLFIYGDSSQVENNLMVANLINSILCSSPVLLFLTVMRISDLSLGKIITPILCVVLI